MSVLVWIQIIAMCIQLWKTLNSETATKEVKDAQVAKSIGLLGRLFPQAKIGEVIGEIPSDDVKTILDAIKDIDAAIKKK